MREVGVLEAKTHLSSLLDGLERGGPDVVIKRRGKPVARLSAVPARQPLGPDFADEVRAFRQQVALEHPDAEPFDLDEAVNAGRP